jgi:Flp pilus assembly protein TadG
MVMFALLLIALIIPVAFVVDIGAARLERRQAQTSADAAALAAVRILADGGSRSDAAAAAIRLTFENTKGTNGAATLADWQARWPGCRDPERPALYVATAAAPVATDCISFTIDNSHVRVKVPTLEVGTNFAGVIGVQSLSTTALAEAEMSTSSGGGYAVFGKSTTCNANATVVLKGGTNIVAGPVHSNNSVQVDGGSNVPDGVSHVGTYTNQAGPTAPNRGTTTVQPDPLAAATMAQWEPGGSLRNAAVAAGVFFDAGSAEINNAYVLAHGSGIYYTTGNVYLTTSSSLSSLRLTFIINKPVSPPPDVSIFETNGTGYGLRYYESATINPDKLLVHTDAPAPACSADKASIHFNGSSGSWEGVLYAPNGSIHLNGSGSGVDLLGAAISNTVLLDGTPQSLL